MRKIIKYSLIIIVILAISFVIYALLNSGEDNGKRKVIEATKIDWTLVLDNGEVPGVSIIKVENVEIYELRDYVEWIKIFNKNNDLISNTEKNGYSKIYVMFDKAGFISTDYTPTKYNGKETTFYIKTNLIEKLIKENEKNIKLYEEE